jgi:hypothetical protein
MFTNIHPTTIIVIKPCSHTALAKAYGISAKVLHTQLKPFKKTIGLRNGYYYNLQQLLIIIEKVGMPCYPIL